MDSREREHFPPGDRLAKMEESIKKAEELIEATNSALARMQDDSSLDDFADLLGGFAEGDRRNRAVDGGRRVLTPTEKKTIDAFSLNKHSIRDDKIDEINNKIEAYRLERESSKGMNYHVPLARPKSDTTLSQRTVTKINLTEDLKAKLEETQEVVNRGIRAARELNETVEVLRSGRQPKSDRRDSSPANKSESVGTVKGIDGKRCKRCNGEITRKTAKQKHRKKEDNVLVTEVRGTETSPPGRRHHLNYQQLPSLRIRGDLTRQRIPSVDIPPERRECYPQRANAAYEMYSHEDKIVAGVKDSNAFVPSASATAAECSNCGKVVGVWDKSVRTEQIDQLLKMCDYNVFDPRIDEFVERYSSCKMPEETKYTQTDAEATEETPKPVSPPQSPRKRRIRDLSNEITRKYREKTTEMESDHLEFEGILRDLFEKMDESRSLFKSCDYLNAVAGKRKASLSVTPPVLLSYTGSGEEADDGRNAVLRPNRTRKSKMPSKVIRKKLERKELEINCKLISSSCPAKGRALRVVTPEATIVKTVSDDAETSVSDRDTAKNREMAKPSSPPRVVAVKPPSPVISAAESKPSPPPEVSLNAVEESVKQTNAVSDYESDFEEESLEEKSTEQRADDNSYKYNARLSTISEVESELDRKISDLAIAPGEKNDGEPEVDPKASSSSSDEDDTRKLLRNVNRDLEIASRQLLSTKRGEKVKKVPEDVAEPLKEVLSALKSQFERTELLADRLTESIKEVNKPEEGEIRLSNGHRDLVMVNNLQRTRKIEENGKSSSPRSNLLRTLREKGEREKGRTRDESPSGSSKGSISTGKSYSEGEISDQEVIVSERSSPSIGEVINEYSDGSLSDEKSVIKFL